MKPFVTRDICGTESGYRKHRRMDEERCQPCKDAHNIVRRTTLYSTEKNRQYASKYKAKHVKPRVEARKKALAEKKAKRRAEIEARKQARKEAGIAYRAQREETRRATAERKARNARKREEERAHIAKTKEEQLQRRLLKEEEKKRKAKERKEAKAKRKADLILKRLEREEAKRLKELLPIDHGTSLKEYARCKKRKQGSCAQCKAVAAKYVRENNKKNPEKSAAWNRLSNNRRYRQARKNGQEFYTKNDVLNRWGTNCHICSKPIDLEAPTQCGEPGWKKGLHLDHVIPLSKGGPDTLENVKPAHGGCNIAKGATF